MTLEELKQLLEENKITQEEYDQKVKELEDKDKDKDKDKDDNTFDIESFLESEDFRDLLNSKLQSETDKIRTKYSSEKKELEKQLDELRQKNMTKEEILQEKESSLKDFEMKVKTRELDFETLKILEEKKLSSDLLTHVSGDDLESRKEQVEQLEKTINDLASLKSEEKFKSQGREIEDGEEKEKNWDEMTLDERIEFAEQNPEEVEKYLN